MGKSNNNIKGFSIPVLIISSLVATIFMNNVVAGMFPSGKIKILALQTPKDKINLALNRYGYSNRHNNEDSNDDYDADGYDEDGYDSEGYNRDGYDEEGYNVEGYNSDGYDEEGYNSDGYNSDGYDEEGYNSDGYNAEGYDDEGYDPKGYNQDGYDENGDSRDDDHDGDDNAFYQPNYLTEQALLRQFDKDVSRDPTSNDLPNPRAISNALIAQKGNTVNVKGVSDMLWLWGQFIDHDIDLTLTDSSKQAPIDIPDYDPVFTGQMGFFRSVTDKQGEQINSITPYIDGSNIYGSSKSVETALRAGSGGKLVVENGLLPKDDIGMFVSGDIRVNENIALTSMHTLWVREHNRIADKLAYEYEDWTDDQLFSAARKIVVAEMQAITFNEFLPLLIGDDTLNDYDGYDEDTSPQIFNTFSTAAYRLGHTMLSSTILRLDKFGDEIPEGHLPLRNAFFNPSLLNEGGVEPIFRGLSAQAAQAIDPELIDDVRNFLFANVSEGGMQGFDLASLNIQRGRDHNLPSYNTVRQALGLDAIDDFYSDEFKEGYADKIQQAYHNMDQVDLWVGGLLEKREGDSLLGPAFTSIVKYQFENIRNGDVSWYENDKFNDDVLDDINSLTLSDVIKRNTDIKNIQEDVFIAQVNVHSKAKKKVSTQTKGKIRALDKLINKGRSRARVRPSVTR